MNLKFFVLVIISAVKLDESTVLGLLSSRSNNYNNGDGGRDRRSQCALPTIPNGTTRLRQRGRLIRFQCNKTFKLIGSVYAGCFGGKWDTPIPVCAKPGCPNLTAPNNGFIMLEQDGAMALLFCNTNYQIAGGRKTYCNGYKWDRPLGSCRETQTTPQLTCDFEVDDLCGWTHDDTDDFEWIRILGHETGTISRRLRTGPQHDHTTQQSYGGHYMLIESFNHLPDDRARLISPIYASKLSKNACFKFFYHMYGATVGDLRVYIKPLSIDINTATQEKKYLYFEISGNQGNKWREAVINLEEFDENFQIIIEGSAGTSHLSDIAIDDVALLDESECIDDTLIETTTTEVEESGGIFDIQSCKTRCDETTSVIQQSTSAYELIQNGTGRNGLIKKCDCHSGCEDLMTCCPDYRSICAFGTTYPVTEENPTETQDLKTTQIPTASTFNLTTTSTTMIPTTKTTTTTTTTPRPTTSTSTKRATTTTTTNTTTTPRPTTSTSTKRATTTTTTNTTTTPRPTTSTSTKRATTTTTTNTTTTSRKPMTSTTLKITSTTSRKPSTTSTTFRTIPTTPSTSKRPTTNTTTSRTPTPYRRQFIRVTTPTTISTIKTTITSTTTKKPKATTMVSYKIFTLPDFRQNTFRNNFSKIIDYYGTEMTTSKAEILLSPKKSHNYGEQQNDPEFIATAVIKKHQWKINDKTSKETTSTIPIWIIVFASIILAICLISISVYAVNYYRYYYGPENYKNNMDKYSKKRKDVHSDVVYFASDEQLDFTLQRLNDDNDDDNKSTE